MGSMSSFDDSTVLVVAPHADDEVLGAGGLIARAAARGARVHVAYLTISGFASDASGGRSTLEEREGEVDAACRTLGVAERSVLFRGEDHHLKLDAIPQVDLVSFLEEVLRKVRPSLAVLPCRGHHHQDHRAAAEASVAALRPAPDSAGRPFVPSVIAYGHSAAGWGGETFQVRPSIFVDITGVIETKIAALACYRSQICPAPHPRSLAAVRNQQAAWGAHAGVVYAEAFECLRWVL
jgi:N-acetylglucosamine malate deacetylase 1